MYDDFFHLRYLLSFSPSQYFLDPAIWQQGPAAVLTPAFLLSLESDLALFGLRPAPFLAHQLAVLAALAVAIYAVVRLWAPRAWAAAAGTLFLLGPMMASVAPRLFVRHYLEALLLAAVSLLLAARAWRRDSWRLAVLSAAVYFAATLCKEIAVPLPALLVLLPAPAGAAPWPRRWQLLIPHAVALSAYVGLRVHLLEPWLSGYGWAATAEPLVSRLGALSWRSGIEIAARQPAGAVMLGVLVAGTALWWRSRASWARALGVAAVALLPVVPVATEMQPRFALAAWCALVVGFSCGCARLAGRGARGDRLAALALIAVALVAAVTANRARWRSELAELQRRSAENLAFAGLGPGEYLRHPREAAGALELLNGLKQERLGGPAGAGWFQDDLFLCASGGEVSRLWEYRAGAVRETTAGLPRLRRAACAPLLARAPLAVRFDWRQDALYWDLQGPPGEFSLVLGEGRERIAVPASGGYRLRGTELNLRVRHDAVDGAVSYSPPLSLSRSAGVVEWREWRESRE